MTHFNNTKAAEDIFREKKVVKNPIKFKIQLNDEQKEAKQLILDNTITLLAGQAGSGKTLLACQVALDGLIRRIYEKIIITRPTVSKEEIGFLPGDLREKWILGFNPFTKIYLPFTIKQKLKNLLQMVK